MNYYSPQQTIVIEKPSNSLGVVGFCLMILGWLTCGLLCVPALILSGIAMMKEPRGLAIAGFILSIPGAAFFFLFGLGFFLTVIGVGATAKNAETKSKVNSHAPFEILRKIPSTNKPIEKSIQ